MIVDFAHNEAGIAAILDVAEGIAGGAAGRATPMPAIIDRRRPARRHVARDRPDRGRAGPEGGDQGDPQLPPRPHPGVGRGRAAGRDPLGRDRRRDRRGARLRDGVSRRPASGAERSRRGALEPERRPARRRQGRGPDVPRGARGGLRPAGRARRPAGRRRLGAHRPDPAPPGAPGADPWRWASAGLGSGAELLPRSFDHSRLWSNWAWPGVPPRISNGRPCTVGAPRALAGACAGTQERP